MRNIIEILADLGIEVPADKHEALSKKVAENYKTIAEHEKKIGRVESERDSLREQLDGARETLKGFEGVDVATMNAQLAEWKKKAEDAEKDYEARLAQRDFEDALKAEIDKIDFSSASAKRAVAERLRSEVTFKNGKLRGFAEAIEDIRAEDASAFVRGADKNPNPAVFTRPITNPPGKTYGSKQDIMNIKDSKERQAAIAANSHLFTRTKNEGE